MKFFKFGFVFIALVATLLTGCTVNEKEHENEETNSVKEIDTGKEIEKSTTPSGENETNAEVMISDDNSMLRRTVENSDSEKTEFHVNSCYCFVDALSSGISHFEIKIENGKIYLGEDMYDNVAYIESYSIKVNDNFVAKLKEPEYYDSKVFYQQLKGELQALEIIKNQKGCYFIDESKYTKYGQQVAIYSIGDTCYILYINDGYAVKMYSGKIK